MTDEHDIPDQDSAADEDATEVLERTDETPETAHRRFSTRTWIAGGIAAILVGAGVTAAIEAADAAADESGETAAVQETDLDSTTADDASATIDPSDSEDGQFGGRGGDLDGDFQGPDGDFAPPEGDFGDGEFGPRGGHRHHGAGDEFAPGDFDGDGSAQSEDLFDAPNDDPDA